ncbi:MAG TPA: GNAT family N-acetyltransferase [Gemmatimonadota bacterium]|jgi:GNAT superfamily N-acetyltransferase
MSTLRSALGTRGLRRLRRDFGILVRQEGVRAFGRGLLRRTTGGIARIARNRVYELDLAEAGPVDAPPGVVLRRFGDGDWDAIASVCTTSALGWLRRNVPRGLWGILALRDGRIVGHDWGASAYVPDPHLFPFPRSPDTTVCTWVWVHPAERGRGIASALLRARLVAEREHGFRRALCAVAFGNDASLRHMVKAVGERGYRFLGVVTNVRVLGYRRRRWRPAGDSAAKAAARPGRPGARTPA